MFTAMHSSLPGTSRDNPWQSWALILGARLPDLTLWFRLLNSEVDGDPGVLDEGHNVAVVHVGHVVVVHSQELIADVELLAGLGRAARHQAACTDV